MAHFSALYCIRNSIQIFKRLCVTKSRENLFGLLILRITTQLQGFLNHRAKILPAIFILRNKGHAFPAHHIGAEDSVLIRIPWPHEAVGGHQNRSRQMIKFLLLVLPCPAEIAHQMRVFFQAVIAVGRKHFPMSVDGDSHALRLL